MFREYKIETLQLFLSALRGNNKDFDKLLKEFPTLAALSNAIKGDEGAIKWMELRAPVEAEDFFLAVDGSKDALKRLSKYPDLFLYHFALSSLGNLAGSNWLEMNNYGDFTGIASDIKSAMDYDKKKNSFWYSMFQG
ncbi:MAG: hypothetical protein LBC89_04095 [Bacteroidales bacterium]|jgi:hypothetical protein|nr:hypothetical protein [Bacteroidales bacterium]